MTNWRNSLSVVNTIQGPSKKEKKDISYRSEPNVDPESTTETYASGTFFVDSDRFRVCAFLLPYRKTRLTQKEPWSMWSSSKLTPSLDLACNQMSWPFISNQMKVLLSINGKEVGEKFSIAPISFLIMKQMRLQIIGASPEPYEINFDVLNNDSIQLQPLARSPCFMAIDWPDWKTMGRKWSTGLWIQVWSMGPTASDDLLAEYGAEWVWNLNLRIKESHLRVVFLIAQMKKKTNCLLNNLSFFLFGLLNQAFQEASHEVFWVEWSDVINLSPNPINFTGISNSSRIARTPHLEPFHRSWLIQFLSQV